MKRSAIPAGRADETLNDPALRARIADFLSDYAHGIDDGRIEEWPGYFTEDGFYQIIPRESFEADLPVGIMHCDGRGMMEDRVQALRKANIFEPHVYCHLLGQPRIREKTPGVYGARTNFSVIRTMQGGGSENFAAGKYLDTVVFVEGMPKLKKRYVVLDSRRIDILLVLPL